LSREMQLLGAHEDRWLAELPASETLRLDWGGFERGFPGVQWGGLTVGVPWKYSSVASETPEAFGDCAWLDWDRIYWSAPFVRLYLDHMTNWHIPLCRPQAARLLGASLLGCVVDENSVESLLKSGQHFTGYLYLKQDELDTALEERLRSAFGERFSRETYWDI